MEKREYPSKSEDKKVAVFEPLSLSEQGVALAPPPFPLSYLSVQEKARLAEEFRREEALPYLRRYAEEIAPEIEEVCDMPLARFRDALGDAWRKVEEENKKVDFFLAGVHRAPFAEWNFAETCIAGKLLSKVLEADHAKNIFSGALKKKIERDAAFLSREYGLSAHERRLLLTPSKPTFYEAYHLDHLKWLVAEGTVRAAWERKLVARYHGGDPALLRERVARMTLPSKEEARGRIKTFEKKLRERAVSKGYLLQERPEAKDLDALLFFDHYQEYLYLYRGTAFPDFFLRKRLIAEGVREGIFRHPPHPLSLTVPQWKKVTEQLARARENMWNIPVVPYRQTDTTCGTACTMMILEKVGVPQTKAVEHDLWSRVGKPYNFPGGLALVLQKHHFPVTYLQDKREIFTPSHHDIRSGNPFLLERAKEYRPQFAEAQAKGLAVHIGAWGFEEILSALKKGGMVVLFVRVGEDAHGEELLHAILAHGYDREGEGDSYRIIAQDPLGFERILEKKRVGAPDSNIHGKARASGGKISRLFFRYFSEEKDSAS